MVETDEQDDEKCALGFMKSNRSTNYTYLKIRQSFTVASLASSSMAARLRNPQPIVPAAVFPVRGAATYKAPGR